MHFVSSFDPLEDGDVCGACLCWQTLFKCLQNELTTKHSFYATKSWYQRKKKNCNRFTNPFPSSICDREHFICTLSTLKLITFRLSSSQGSRVTVLYRWERDTRAALKKREHPRMTSIDSFHWFISMEEVKGRKKASENPSLNLSVFYANRLLELSIQ